MSQFYRTKEFHDLSKEWRARLIESGFEDLEDAQENLKSKDKRTIAYENQDEIREFFLRLDHFMYFYPEMPRFERTVMELYSQGVYIKTIVKRVRASDKKVRNVVSRYKKLILAINRLLLNTDFPHILRGSDNPQGCGDSGPFKI